MNLTEKLEELETEVTETILRLVNTSVGTDSDVVGEKVLQLEEGKDDELMYNIDGTSTYVVAVSPTALISKTGYSYGHSGIEFEQLCEIVDSFNK